MLKEDSSPRFPRRASRWRGALAVLVLSATAACGPSGPVVVPVSGTVTHNGEPIGGMWITFTPAHGRPSMGVSKPDGSFELTYSREQKGALVGAHTVSVMFRPSNMQEEMEMARGKKLHANQDEIAAKFGAGGTEPIEVEVSRKNRKFDLKLD